MIERESQPILKKVKHLPEHRQCLRDPHYECACCLSDEETRRTTLRKLRQELGAYSFMNLFDDGLAERHEQRRRQLCEGRIPTLPERIRNFFLHQ